MQIIDLSHLLNNDTPVYPGTQKPIFSDVNTIVNDGFAETKISFCSHTGTHMDSPAHMIYGTKTLDQFAVSKFYGKAICIDCTNYGDSEITKEHLFLILNKTKSIDFVLLNTGWSKKWGHKDYFVGFPTLSLSACEYLAGLNLKGIGIDAISIDKIDSILFDNHMLLLKNELIIIENLSNLDVIKNQSFIFSCFPLKFENADGSPVRAVAIINE